MIPPYPPRLLLKRSHHFHALLCQIRESLLQNSQTACCIIELPRPFQNQKNMEILEKILPDLKIIFNQNILIRRHHFHLEITASIMVVRELLLIYLMPPFRRAGKKTAVSIFCRLGHQL